MKKLTAIFIVVILACRSNSSSNNTLDSIEEDTFGMTIVAADTTNLVDSAKGLINESCDLVKKEILGELDKHTVDSLVNPIMINYLAVFKQLNPTDSLIVHDYRQHKINRLLELQSKKSIH